MFIIVTIIHDFQNCHIYHNCHVTIAIYQNWSQLSKLVKILTIDHNYLQLLTIIQSQLLFFTIGNNYHKFIELPQLVIFFMNCQNCDYLTEFLQLVKTVTIGQNYLNWSKIVTICQNCYNWSKLSQLVTIVTITIVTFDLVTLVTTVCCLTVFRQI